MAAAENKRISPARLALAVRKLRAERADLELAASDPIAIVGMGCRFPGGADSPAEFWQRLREGRDLIGEVPRERWKDWAALAPRMRQGGYLEEIDGFDAAFFGISPREALHMDPQQRLLLEVTWEALWDAGIEPEGLSGSDAGVFTALYNNDYAKLHSKDEANLTAHAGIGTAHSVATGRVSFLLNVSGPSLVIDSACSSSLVAVHLACQSLRAGECGMAIASAASLKPISDEVRVFAQWGMLASDGRCKTFDARADGFVPGEGAAAVVLKRLSDALEQGDRIHAVIRGTAVNHDGRTTVLTAPSGLAQQGVLQAALKNAMIEPGEVSYIEAHGTGTSLGDPIEVEALSAVYGAAGETECWLGAVKTNIGHLEAAAGLAGLIKTVLSLEQEEIPPNLHFERLNPEITLEGMRLRLANGNVPWPRGERPRVAAISSFGLGGTNGHVIVEEAPAARPAARRTIPLGGHRWQRERLWLAEPRARQLPEAKIAPAEVGVGHPLLGQRVDSAFIKGALFRSELSLEALPYLEDHRLGERPLMPFAAFLETAAAALRAAGHQAAIRNFLMHEPCFIAADGGQLQVLVEDSSVAIASGGVSAWATHARGSFERAESANNEQADSKLLRARCSRPMECARIYETLERTGLRYGPSFRTIRAAWAGDGEALAQLRLPEEMREEAARYDLHPALLDGALQTLAVVMETADGELLLPVGVDRFAIAGERGPSELWVHTRLGEAGAQTVSADLTLMTGAGEIVARLTGFTAKRTTERAVSGGKNLAAAGLSYAIEWQPEPLPAIEEKRGPREPWLVVERRRGSSRELWEMLAERGMECRIVELKEIDANLLRAAEWQGIVFDARGGEGLPDAQWGWQEQEAVEFVFELARSGSISARLCMLAQEAVAVLPSEDIRHLEQAPLLGLLRTLALEYPEARPCWIDAGEQALTPGGRRETDAMLAQEIAAGTPEPLVGLRNGVRYVARLTHAVGEPKTQRLAINSSGRLEDLRIEPMERRAPGPGEVEIEVRAAGLNFRDVLTALGMLPARAPTPGAECAGIVARVGEGVERVRPGDAVLAFAPASLANYVTVTESFVVKKPAAMTFAEAAGIPVAFLTAHYGLDRLAKLASGQTILIHAGAGGLGLAAVELARAAGARVLATAGSTEKREYLRQRGVEQVFDSRSVSFRDEVLRATEGRGVDVVLNSLAGEFIAASFAVTAAGGCFLEVGKRGIWTEEQVRALDKGIRYFPFDLGYAATDDATLIPAMFGELMERFAAGGLKPLPTRLFAFEEATEAYRTMAQARHIGKLVLGLESRDAMPLGERLDGTVLITGGLGALGMETARWAAAQGARRIVLAGRNLPAGEIALAEELKAQGVELALERMDVACSEEVDGVLGRLRAVGPPLVAVIHAAGVVRDAVLANESWENYEEVTAAKIRGAWNLDRLTEKDPIRLMVFYSSAAAILGSPGQGSYAAGNAFLDALAHHRESRGKRTLSVNWGAWGSAGMAARLEAGQGARWSRLGVVPMEAGEAFAALGRAVEAVRSQVAIMDIEWERFLGNTPERADAAFFSRLRPQPSASLRQTTARPESILEILGLAPPVERQPLLAAHVKACARRVLGLGDGAGIDERVPLQDIGLDSLMALEMRNELAQSLDRTLAAGILFDYPSVEQVTGHLLGLMAEDSKSDAAQSLAAMSEEEAERMLLEELGPAERESANV